MGRPGAGAHWEDLALAHLSDAGLALVARNFHSRFGEIDLVMCEDNTLVFVEVRYRGPGARVRAAASVSASKQRHLVQTAQFFLLRQPQWRHARMRFDVLAIDGDASDQQHTQWIRDAFRAG